MRTMQGSSPFQFLRRRVGVYFVTDANRPGDATNAPGHDTGEVTPMRDKLSARTVDRKHVSLVSRNEIRIPHDPVADAWYAANCPADFVPRRHVSRSDWLRWRLNRMVPAFARRAWKRLVCAHRWVPDNADSSTAWCFHCQATARVVDA